MSTPGLALPHLSPTQSNKAVSVNAIADGLDGALTQFAVIDCSGGADIAPLSSAVLPFVCLKLIGIVTASLNLILPSSGHLYFVNNMTPYRPWQASHVQAMSDQIIDPSGHVQQVTGLTGDHKTGGSEPSPFNDVGGTTTDNHVTWTDEGLALVCTITVKCGAGANVVLNAGDRKFVYCDGVNAFSPN
jgi:hypothetical protein